MGEKIMLSIIEQKRKEDWRYLYHGNHDVSDILNKLLSYPEEEWWIDRTRQQMFPFVHKDTTTLFVSEITATWELGQPFEPTVRLKDPELWKMVEPIISHYEKKYDGKAGKVAFLRLPVNKVVYPHRDEGDYLGLVHRHHIAIQTNEDAIFSVDKEEKHMKPGDCWEINNAKTHGVANNGTTNRIHLLFDIMPNKHIE
jgi:hypothetical protein